MPLGHPRVLDKHRLPIIVVIMPAALDLSTVSVRPIHASELERWQRLMEEEHYLQSNRMVGEQIRYVALDGDGRWVGCLGWSAGCRHLSGRDRWIGWSEGQRAMRLHLVANNARFLVLGKRGETPNLASKILSLNLDRLSRDWQEAYGHPVLMVETFVDLQRRREDGTAVELSEREAGACYRAVGFVACGRTRGFRRVRGGFKRHAQRRLLLVREVVAGGSAVLTDQTTLWDREDRAPARHRLDLLSLPSAFDPERGLIAHLEARVPDPRQVRQYSWRCILAGLLGGVLAGKQTMKDIAAWARNLPEEAIVRLGGRWKKGKRTMPAANTYGYALEHADLGKLNEALRSWLTDNGITWSNDIIAVDGKALLGAGRTGKSRATASAFSVTRRAVLALEGHTGDERKAVKTCLRQLDLDGCIVTGDALHTSADFAEADILKKGRNSSSNSRPTSRSSWRAPSASTGPVPPSPRSPGATPSTDGVSSVSSAAST
jgi:hypothetical protein